METNNKNIDNKQDLNDFQKIIIGIILCSVIGLLILGFFLTYHFAVQHPFLVNLYIKDMTFFEKILHVDKIFVLYYLSIIIWELIYGIVVLILVMYHERISNLRLLKTKFEGRL